MEIEQFSNTIATLLTNGFHIHKINRFSPDNVIVNARKYDRLGAEVRYSVMFSNDNQETAIIESLKKICEAYNSHPIYVNDNYVIKGITSHTQKSFFDFFGGIITIGLTLIPNLATILNELGHNRLPTSLSGDPEDLHELYVAECLQFILESPTRRYGQERAFESLPDGIVLGKGFMILMDSKAYSRGFSFQADDIKRFASYVEDFNSRYSQFFGRVFTFLVVSGNFTDSKKSIQGRSEELYKKCGCKLSCLTSKVLGDIVQLMQQKPRERTSINWENILINQQIEMKHVNQEIKRIQKDKIH
ncbi:restriction endonuclease FokI C-terminal domain-containing protein [Cyclobacterium plantarum]|uniref:restriction endonuclease FokI C-terminal domain-containing protein n=1 Tax=Cyclobacterium plantarum TaxID=2716263 RepID=UPI003F71298A